MVEKNGDDGGSTADFYDMRRQWIDYICEHRDVKHATFRIGYWMARRMNANDQAMWWTVKRMAKHLGVDRKTIMSAIAELDRLNLMVVHRTLGKQNRYSIRLPHH
ncbi:MAG: helix-turn-helix domain-containing protein [Mesorhizobium sp.]|uniref:helix-turn-helix domain-containing protein n=1 Tax=Mesorhizobium sp. TaxID=1871066 RepID=UPI000FE6D8A7|nr:helix-turn-helix domain-containing protein [Mesorhizobium sp.]RWO34767.1 MAG: helix-turn-helix domain-containing protein [Mesorhizobium sp.]